MKNYFKNSVLLILLPMLIACGETKDEPKVVKSETFYCLNEETNEFEVLNKTDYSYNDKKQLVREESFSYENGVVVEQNYRIDSEYDDNGNCVLMTWYEKNDDETFYIDSKNEYKYENNLLVEEKFYELTEGSNNLSLYDIVNYDYDSLGRMIKVTGHDLKEGSDELFLSYTLDVTYLKQTKEAVKELYKYFNEEGENTNTTELLKYYDDNDCLLYSVEKVDGVITYVTHNSSDEKGNLVSEITYKVISEEEKVITSVVTYVYDENGNETAEYSSASYDGYEYRRAYGFEYDKDGNLTKMLSYDYNFDTNEYVLTMYIESIYE